MNKKRIIFIGFISALLVFTLTTLFYLTPTGALLFGKIADSVNDLGYSKFIRIGNLIENNYMGDYNASSLMNNALHSYVGTLNDPYSTYLDAEEFESLQSNLEGEYRGIGITVAAEDGNILIKDVKPDSPAEKAGILVGDILISVNGTDYNSDSLSQAVSVIKSVEQGNSVDLTVMREGEKKDITVNVEKIHMIYVSGKMLEPTVGYIRIETFGHKVEEEFSAYLESHKAEGMRGLILDLRSNPGGSLESAVSVADLLLGKGNIVTIRDNNGNEDIYTSDENALDLPICVLINEESASASEVVAGALRDHGKATLIGKKSFGKGVVQSIYNFGDGTGLRLTTAKYFTPSGECINGVGIEPDMNVNLPLGVEFSDLADNPENDTQLAAAIQEIKNKAE